MSDMGAVMDALTTAAEGAIAGLSSERAVRLLEDLATGDFPHLFVYDPEETVELFAHHQERTTLEVTLTLATTGETQEALALKLDALRDAIRADTTLGGIVLWAYVSRRAIRQHPEQPALAAGELVVVTVTEA